MSRKAFIIWGLGLINTYALGKALLTYLTFSNIIELEALQTSLWPISSFFDALWIIFGVVLWKRLRASGYPIRTFFLCFLFGIAAFTLSVFPVIAFHDVAGFHTHALMPIVDAKGAGSDPTVWMNVKISLYMLSAFYIQQWGLFALLWFGSRDPKAPNSIWQKAKHLIKRAPKQTPLQADPILVNGAW